MLKGQAICLTESLRKRKRNDMLTVSSILWRVVLLGFMATVFAFFKVDVATAQQIGQATGLAMFAATIATLWDF